MLIFITYIFWSSFGLLVYTYLGYPFILAIWALFAKSRNHRGTVVYPFLTLVIAARNEEKVIGDKIQNSLKLDYPRDRLEILVVSDSSSDGTNDIVSRFEEDNIHLLKLKERKGKTGAQNIAVKQAKGDIIVFSDANAFYAKDSLQRLAGHFSDPQVDFVSGELCYTESHGSEAGQKENLYWRFEKWVKRLEDRVGCITGANGSIYAVRKESYIPLEYDQISDFMEPLLIAGRGGTVIYEPEAKSYEPSSDSFDQEFRRKRRILSRSLFSLSKNRWLFNPRHTGRLAWQIISHKVLRWATPLFLLTLFVSNLFLVVWGNTLLFFFAQMIFYLLAVLGHWITLPRGNFILTVPYYFVLLNYASLCGLWDFVSGRPAVFWEPIRQ